MQKIISIVTINYNNSDGLRLTYSSIENQTDKDFNWIVVDGGSTDGSKDTLEDIRLNSELSVSVISERDNGIYDAMNKGIFNSEADFFIFINSGDRLASSATVSELKKLLSSKAGCDIILGAFSYNGNIKLPKPIWWKYWALPTSHQSILYRASLLKNNTYDHNLRFAGDFEHFIRITNKSKLSICLTDMHISINEPYGSNAHLEAVMNEYRLVIENLFGKIISRVYFLFKFNYLKMRLKK